MEDERARTPFRLVHLPLFLLSFFSRARGRRERKEEEEDETVDEPQSFFLHFSFSKEEKERKKVAHHVFILLFHGL